MNLDFKELNDLLCYSFDGVFSLKKDGKLKRIILPDEEGYLKFYRNGRKYKIKANRAAMLLVTGKDLGLTDVILHKNLDQTDYRLQNLTIIDRGVYNKIKEAHRNLSGALSMSPHPTDAYSYVITWREAGKDRVKVVQDVVVARRIFVKLQLKYAKILNSYCVFD